MTAASASTTLPTDLPLPPSSPITSSASDSDDYNTQSARVYFGPVKTPERKFATQAGHLFVSSQAGPVPRRSPRISSPRRSASADDSNDSEEGAEVEQVVQLVGEVQDEGEGDSGAPLRLAIAETEVLLPDEPSSALASRILHAVDNPSPPPSPPLLAIFDPYHASNPRNSPKNEDDTLSSDTAGAPIMDVDNPCFLSLDSGLPSSSSPPVTNESTSAAAQQDLISFDTPQRPDASMPARPAFSTPLGVTHSNDLLTNSPNFLQPPAKETSRSAPELSSEQEGHSNLMDVVANLIQIGSSPEKLDNVHNSQFLVAEQVITPLRRSPRPRRSVTPNPPPSVIPISPAPFTSRTRVKRKSGVSNVDKDIVSDSAEDDDQRTPPRNRSPTRERPRHSSPRRPPLSFHRELGSLSPTSSSLLSKLGFAGVTEDAQEEQSGNSPPDAQMVSFSIFQSDVDQNPTDTPLRPSGPIRFSPSKRGTASPAKFRIQTPAPNDPTVTPARRIAVGLGPSQSNPSPLKGVQLDFSGLGVPPVSTPARRVLVSEREPIASSSNSAAGASVSRIASPSKALLGISKDRMPSIEPATRKVLNGKGKAKAIDSTSLASGEYASTGRPGKLPFPIVATKAAEATSAASGVTDPPPKATSPKTNLKKPTSRIPRIGVKPYARSTQSKLSEQVKVAASTRVSAAPKPPAGPSTTSSSRSRGGTSTKVTPGPSTSTAAARSTRPTLDTASSLLKRKREAEKTSPVKPRVIRPILSRRVDMTPKQSETAVASLSSGAPEVRHSSPMPSSSSANPASSSLTQQFGEPQPPIINVHRPSPPLVPQENPQSMNSELTMDPGSPMQQDPPPQSHRESSPLPPVEPPAPSATPAVPAPKEETPPHLRRTTRATRRTVINAQDRPMELPVRAPRRKPTPRPIIDVNDVFSTMSLTALKDLTATNTARNQEYLAAKLETEVIRMEGARPDSPLVKVKSIAQRQLEEKERQRLARAERRAKRTDSMASSDVDGGFSDVGYSSPCEERGDSEPAEDLLPKHTRGPGDDGDYETPERADRTITRTRLAGDGEEQEYEDMERRVKWDRGLFTLVYLDEVQLGSRQTPKEHRGLKSILAPAAKALRLDTLGNLPQTGSPLAALTPENIVIKKFVYDNEEPVVEEVVVKPTKSSRKKK